MPRCNGCGNNFPRHELVHQQVLKGHNGRRSNGTLLMCPSCASATQENNKIVAIICIGVMLVFGIIVIAVRGY